MAVSRDRPSLRSPWTARARRWQRATEGISVVVVAPQAITAIGVREVLDRESDIDVVATVATPGDAVSVATLARPDVVLIDLSMSDSKTMKAAERLRGAVPAAAFVVLGRVRQPFSAAGDGRPVAQLDELACPPDLVAAVRRAASRDERPYHDVVGDGMRDAVAADSLVPSPLTSRETDVLVRVAAGLRNSEIAYELGVSGQTVKNHLSAILHKFGVRNRTRAVTYAMRHGWLDLNDFASDIRTDSAEHGEEALP